MLQSISSINNQRIVHKDEGSAGALGKRSWFKAVTSLTW